MNTYKLVLASPDGNLFECEVTMLTVRGALGDLAVLAGHIPVVTAVVPSTGKIVTAEGKTVPFHVEGGILSVSKDCVTLLSGSLVLQEPQ